MRLSKIHTGFGDFGNTESLEGVRVDKDHPNLLFNNHVLRVSSLLRKNLYKIESKKDREFIDKLIIKRWLGGLLGSAYFKFQKLGVSKEISDWMEERINYFHTQFDDLMEFILPESERAIELEFVLTYIRDLEPYYYRVVKELYGEDFLKHLRNTPFLFYGEKKVIHNNGRFLNLLGDYFFALIRWEFTDSTYWDNPNKSSKPDCEILKELDPES